MAETTDSIKQGVTPTTRPGPEVVRDALLRLRQLAAHLPAIDATAVIRDIREAGLPTN